MTGLFPGTTYDAFLIALGVEGESAVSRSTQGVASATLTFSTLPSGPFPVTAIVNGPTFISVTWGSVPGATGYEIWKSQFFGGGFTDYVLFTSTGNSMLSTSDFTVEGSRSYRYAVRAQIGSEFTSFRESNIANTPMAAPNITEVRALDASSMLIQWSDPNPVVQGYILERALNSDGPFTGVRTVLGTLFQPPPRGVIDTGLSARRTYYYRVSSFHLFGDVSPPSSVESGTTFPPLHVADATPNTITIFWELEDDTARYLVGRSDSAREGPYDEIGAVDHPGEKYSDTGLTPSSVYYYRVVPDLLKGGFGEITEIREASTAPLPPTALSAELSASSPPQTTLTWAAGSAADEYVIQWRPPGGNFINIATNANPSLSFVHQDPHPGQNDYRVRARFRGVTSALSGIASVDWIGTDQDVWAGLVSYWPLDELSDDGLTTPDLVSGNHLTLRGMDAGDLVAGQRGQAMAFNGTDQFLVHITPPGMDSGLPISRAPAFSVALWVNGDGLGQSDRRVFSESSSVDNDPLFNMGTHNSGANAALDIYVRNSGVQIDHFQSSRPAFDGQWRHIAWAQENGEASLYVDGILEQSFSYTPGPVPMDVSSIGAILRATDVAHFAGAIDDVMVWERALTHEEINQVMTQGIETPVPVFAPIITIQPVGGVFLTTGHSLTLSVRATGTRPLSYEWRKDGAPLGANEANLRIENLQPTDSGIYTVLVGNGAGAVLSAEADLVPGYQGFALRFDGGRETLAARVHNLGDELPANQHESFSISMRTLVAGAGQTDLRLFSEAHTDNPNPLFNLGTSNDGGTGHLDIFIRQTADGLDHLGTVGHLHTGAEPLDGTWRYLVFVQNAGQRHVYIDGALDDLEIPAKTAGLFLMNNTSLGGILRESASHWVSGVIDEVSIWSRGLTEDEIALLHTEGLPQAQPRRFRIEGAAARQVTTESIFEITWASAPDAVYTVQRKNSISNAEWTDVVTNLPSGGATTTFSLDVSDQSSGFYRIVLEPL